MRVYSTLDEARPAVTLAYHFVAVTPQKALNDHTRWTHMLTTRPAALHVTPSHPSAGSLCVVHDMGHPLPFDAAVRRATLSPGRGNRY